ncbi:MAG: 2-amino-4-hydroxy-6-hydroxymethyldihydropteridine diphosphokinase [Gammaproteobacteria bacterium]|nr:2-amino-4-hydroxy-6-hydroxymethyldihydropteridine diphosphokinase [Gammaproteobacteria bacterium]
MSVLVYIGLGSNLNDPQQQIESALLALQAVAIDSTMTVSARYITQPVGPQDQPDFVNAVAGFHTHLSADELLDRLFEIEDAQQRQRGAEQWGPRTLDLDLLLYGDEMTSTDRLQIPHPRIHERAFVLQPLSDIAPELQIPGQGTVSGLLASCDLSGIRKQVKDV